MLSVVFLRPLWGRRVMRVVEGKKLLLGIAKTLISNFNT
jgi:hypothetical protein